MKSRPRYSPGEVYGLYCALRAHFTRWDYDFHKYFGKLNGINQRSYDARGDRWAFEKLARHPDPFGMLLANIAEHPHIWIGEIDEEVYWTHRRNIESLEYHIGQQLPLLDPDYRSNFVRRSPGTHPKLIRLLLGGRISLQTATILADMSHCLLYWNKIMKGDSLFEEIVRRIVKYRSFIKYDKSVIQTIIDNKA